MRSSDQHLDGLWQARYLDAAGWPDIETARARSLWPHTATLPGQRAEPGRNAALYRRTLELAPPPPGHRVELTIGAAMLATRAWLNGRLLGEHWGAYTPFTFDLTAALRPGENELVLGVLGEHATFFDTADGRRAARCAVGVSALMLDPPARARWCAQTGLAAPCSRFGVWQSIRLQTRPAAAIEDVFVHADPGLTALDLELGHSFTSSPAWSVTLTDTAGRVVASRVFEPGPHLPPLAREPGSPHTRLALRWPAPPLRPWSPAYPNLYHATVAALAPGTAAPLDAVSVRFGWRSFTIDRGHFFLNGCKTVLRGESDLFQNQGYQFYDPHGLDIAALRDPAGIRAWLASLKRDLGLNAFRQHAAIGAPAVFDAADELGLLVLDQSSIWSRGHPFYLAAGDVFIDQARREFETWIRRDRNHPSVVIWGVDNEMLRIASPEPAVCAFFRQLGDVVADLDPTRPRSFDGGAAVADAGDLWHVHHEENYDVILDRWRREKPLVFGEFWIGGRNAERRLTSAAEFASAAEYWREMNRLWVRKIIGLRLGDAAGVMPYNFSAQILAPRLRQRLSAAGAAPWSEPWLPADGAIDHDPAARAAFRHALGPHLVEFASRCDAFYLDAGQSIPLPVAIRNDSGDAAIFTLRWFVDDQAAGSLQVEIAAGEAARPTIALAPPTAPSAVIRLTLESPLAGEVDRTGRRLHFAPRSTAPLSLPLPVHFLPDASVEPYVAHLATLGVTATPWPAATPPAAALILAAPAAVPAFLAENPQRDLRLFVTEGPADFPGWLGTGGLFDLRRPYLHSNHFEPIIGRPLELDDLYHPQEALVEDPDHPALADWPAGPFSGFDDDHQDRVSRGVIAHPGTSLNNIMGDTRSVGAAMSVAGSDDDSAHAPTTAAPSFRPLLSGSRREYATLAEIATGPHRLIVNRLRLASALGRHPSADALLANTLRHLADAPATETVPAPVLVWDAATPPPAVDDWSDHRRILVHNLSAVSEESLQWISRRVGALALAPRAESVNHVAVEHGGVFAASKSATLFADSPPFSHVLAWEEPAAIVGAWRLLRVNASFEVKGHAFPWEWRSDYPKFAGYAALHLFRHHRDIVLLQENPFDPAVAATGRYRVVLENLARL